MKRSWRLWLLGLALTVAGCQSAPAPAPADEAVGFANPELLVETDWLAEHLGDEGIRILDTRNEEKYEAGHIPGAIRIDDADVYDPDPDREPGAMVGSPDQIATRLGAKGVDEYVHVIVYDEGVATTAARVFWTLEYYGHPRVSLLNGGITKWQAEARELATEQPTPTPVSFTVRTNPAALSTQEEIHADLADESAVILDVRSDEEFTGDVARAERRGHIQGAVHIEWTKNFTEGDAPVFKPAFQLAQMYADQGVTRDKRVHAY